MSSENVEAPSNNHGEAPGQSNAAAAAGEQRHACAACKHQRKRCDYKTCVFWPYFPGEKKEEFEAVHKIFGVIKVKKMLESCNSAEQRQSTADQLKWAAREFNKGPGEGPLKSLYMALHEKDVEISQMRNEIDMLRRLFRFQNNNVVGCGSTSVRHFNLAEGASSRDGEVHNSQSMQYGQLGYHPWMFANSGYTRDNMGNAEGAPKAPAIVGSHQLPQFHPGSQMPQFHQGLLQHGAPSVGYTAFSGLSGTGTSDIWGLGIPGNRVFTMENHNRPSNYDQKPQQQQQPVVRSDDSEEKKEQ